MKRLSLAFLFAGGLLSAGLLLAFNSSATAEMSIADKASLIRQDRKVIGKVTDSCGNPIPSVAVRVKGTNIGTFTDASGNYSISVPNSSSNILVFSLVGCTTKEVSVPGTNVVNVQLICEGGCL